MTENIRDYVPLAGELGGRGEPHHGLVLVDPGKFHRGSGRTIGRMVTALDDGSSTTARAMPPAWSSSCDSPLGPASPRDLGPRRASPQGGFLAGAAISGYEPRVATMYPRTLLDADVKTSSERKVFDRLEADLPDGWDVFHSSGWVARDAAEGSEGAAECYIG